MRDKFREFPPEPESSPPDVECFSAFQRDLRNKSGAVSACATLGFHVTIIVMWYIMHLINEGPYSDVDSAVSFECKPYTEFNAAKRTEANNAFEQ